MSVEEDTNESITRTSENISHSTNIAVQESDNGRNVTTYFRQLFASSSAIVGSLCFGMTTAFTATLLPQIPEMANLETGSWLASSVVISMVAGVGVCSFTMRLYGRRISLICSNVPWLVGWPCMSLASNVAVLLLGCCLVGFSAGFNSSSTTVYTAEITEPKMRGLVAIYVSVAVALGILVSHLLGVLLFWRVALAVSLFVPMISFTLAIFAPETPSWLILNDREEEANETFLWLRGKSKEAEHEFDALRAKRTENVERNKRGIRRNISSSNFLKPFFILSFMFVVQQGSGLNMVAFYAVDTLKRMSKSVDVRNSTVLIDSVRIFSTIVSVILIKTMRRRSLFFASAAATFVSLVAIIVAIRNQLSDDFLVVSICAYIWSVYLGIIPIPWIMCGEVYPTIMRDLGSGVTTIYAFVVIFVIVKTGPLMMEYVEIQFTFGVYAIIVLLGSTVLYFIMPETKNVTLQQVEDRLSNCR